MMNRKNPGRILKKEALYILISLFILSINAMRFAGPAEAPRAAGKSIDAEFPVESEGERGLIGEAKSREEAIKSYLVSHPREEKIIAGILFMLMLILLAGIGMNIRSFAGGESYLCHVQDRQKSIFEGKWSIGDVIRVVILLAGFGYLISYAVYFAKDVIPFFGTVNARTLSGSTIIDIGSIIGVIWYVRHRYNQGPEYLGLTAKCPRRALASAFAGYIAILPWLALVLLIISIAVNLTGYEPEPQAVYDLFMEEESPAILAYTTFFAAVAGPVFEEIFFRGFFFAALRRRFSFPRAATLSAFFFSFLHFTPVGFIPIMMLGMLFCYLYEKSDTLLAPISVHIVHNAAMIYGVFFLKKVFGSI